LCQNKIAGSGIWAENIYTRIYDDQGLLRSESFDGTYDVRFPLSNIWKINYGYTFYDFGKPQTIIRTETDGDTVDRVEYEYGTVDAAVKRSGKPNYVSIVRSGRYIQLCWSVVVGEYNLQSAMVKFYNINGRQIAESVVHIENKLVAAVWYPLCAT
jgi:hypothetical protein